MLRKHATSSEDIFRSEDGVQNDRVKDAIECASATDKGTLFTVAISSRRVKAVKFITRLIELNIEDKCKVSIIEKEG